MSYTAFAHATGRTVDLVTTFALSPAQFAARTKAYAAKTAFFAGKAKIVHTDDNPTEGMIDRDPKLRMKWKPATDKEMSRSIAVDHPF